MSLDLHKWLRYRYPQNYILRNPIQGALVITIITFGFTVLYKPLGVQASRSFSIVTTMAVYSAISGAATILIVRLLKSLKWFKDSKDWTIFRELLSIIIVPIGTGMIIYLAGFIIEVQGDRLNIATFVDSIIRSFMIGIFPFIFFTVRNYYYLFPQTNNSFSDKQGFSESKSTDKPVLITSQLKKESLRFRPEELIYAESDGNYVIFYLDRNKQVKKEIIRNSINNIEQQLSEIPYFLRTHRAFIVNLKKVTSRHGTTLGYRLKLAGTENRIPVSRNNTSKYNQVFSRLEVD